MPEIHPTAIVAPGAELGEDVYVGPYCVVGPGIKLGARTRLTAHVFMDGSTAVGEGCLFYPFSSIGTRTQDLKYKGGEPRLEIGNRTTVRESVTLNAATADGDVTVVGSDCLLMAYAHVAHDCRLGNHVILANCATLAGHVRIEDQAIVGGLSGVHQFVHIGRLSIVGGCSKVTQDVPPYMLAEGHPLVVRGVNTVGVKRKGVSEPVQKGLKQAYRMLYRNGLSTSQAIAKIEEELPASPEIEHLLTFVKTSERGITK